MVGIKRRKAGVPSRELRTIAGRIPNPPALDLVHVTAVGAAVEIVKTGQIEKRACKIFQRELAYFFLGRPAYRLADSNRKSDQINRFHSSL